MNIVKNGFDVTAVWSRDTGLLESYEYSGPAFDEGTGDISFTIVRTSEDVVVPPTTTTGNDETGDEPGLDLPVSNSSLLAVPFMGIVTLIIRRRKNN